MSERYRGRVSETAAAMVEPIFQQFGDFETYGGEALRAGSEVRLRHLLREPRPAEER